MTITLNYMVYDSSISPNTKNNIRMVYENWTPPWCLAKFPWTCGGWIEQPKCRNQQPNQLLLIQGRAHTFLASLFNLPWAWLYPESKNLKTSIATKNVQNRQGFFHQCVCFFCQELFVSSGPRNPLRTGEVLYEHD